MTSNVGLMCRTAEDVVTASRALLATEEAVESAAAVDHEVVPLPWREERFLRAGRAKLRVGWYDHDGIFQATPGVRYVRKVPILLPNPFS